MNEKYFEYLRNINTSPGPGAGRSIDPSKPGPDDITRSSGNVFADLGLPDADKLLEEAKIRAQSDVEPGPLAKCTARDAYPSPLDCIYPDCQCERTETGKRALAQSDAEPVAWQYRWKPTQATGWTEWHSIPQEELGKYPNPIYETRCLYTAPPRPDASAGLIEAAEMAEEHASMYCYDSETEQGLLRNFGQRLRARAADRSGK